MITGVAWGAAMAIMGGTLARKHVAEQRLLIESETKVPQCPRKHWRSMRQPRAYVRRRRLPVGAELHSISESVKSLPATQCLDIGTRNHHHVDCKEMDHTISWTKSSFWTTKAKWNRFYWPYVLCSAFNLFTLIRIEMAQCGDKLVSSFRTLFANLDGGVAK